MDFAIMEDRLHRVIRESTDADFGPAFRGLAREIEAELENLAERGEPARFAEWTRSLVAAVEKLQGRRLWPGFRLGPLPEELSAGLHDLLDALLEARELTVIHRTGVEWLRQLVAQVRRAEDIQFTLETQYLPWGMPDRLERALAALAAEGTDPIEPRPQPGPGGPSRQDLRLTSLEIRRAGSEAAIRARLLHAALAEHLGKPESVPEADLALPESLLWHVSGWTAGELIDQLATLAGKAGREGLFSLEEDLHRGDLYPLLRSGLTLLLDGAPWETIEEDLAALVDEERRRLEEKENLIERGVAGILRQDPPDQLLRMLTSESGSREESAGAGLPPLIERMAACAGRVRIDGEEALRLAAQREEDAMLRLALRIAVRYSNDRGRYQSRLNRVFERSEEDQDLLASIAAEGIGLIYEQADERYLRARLAALVPFADADGESAAGVAEVRRKVRAEAAIRTRSRKRPRLAELLILEAEDPTDGLHALEELAAVSAEAEATAELLARTSAERISLRDLKVRLQQAERELGTFLAERRELESELADWLDGPFERPGGGPTPEGPGF